MLLFSPNTFYLLDFSQTLQIKIYKTIILPVVLNGWETWSLTLREKCRVRILENRNLRRVNGAQHGSKLRVEKAPQ